MLDTNLLSVRCVAYLLGFGLGFDLTGLLFEEKEVSCANCQCLFCELFYTHILLECLLYAKL
jgi:hypothetical protein